MTLLNFTLMKHKLFFQKDSVRSFQTKPENNVNLRTIELSLASSSTEDSPSHSDRHNEQRLDVYAKHSTVRSAPSDVGGLRRSTCVCSKAHVPSRHHTYQSDTGVTICNLKPCLNASTSQVSQTKVALKLKKARRGYKT